MLRAVPVADGSLANHLGGLLVGSDKPWPVIDDFCNQAFQEWEKCRRSLHR